jgi:putative flippase GtrA
MAASPVKFFGREPSVILGALAIVVQFVSAFAINVSQTTQTAINVAAAALVGFIVAYMVKDEGTFAAFVGLGQAALALAMNLGLHWSADKQTAFMALFTILGQFWLVRDRVTAPVSKEQLRLAA